MTDAIDNTLLASRFRAGDRDAFGALYAATRDAAYATAIRILRCPNAADDVVQSAFIRAWNARERLREAGAFRGWLLRIVANLARTLCVRRARFVAFEVGCEPQVAVTAHDVLEAREATEALDEAIERLSPRQCQVIALRVREDLSFKEIGARLGCSDVSARVNYLYGVRNLQSRMAA